MLGVQEEVPQPHRCAIHHSQPFVEENCELEIISLTDSLKLGYNKYPLRRKKKVAAKDEHGCSDVSYKFLERRSVVENGQLVVKPAAKCYVRLKDGPPEGCDKDSFYLRFLGKVCSNPGEAYGKDARDSDNVFSAVLTEDEYAKLEGMDEVEAAMQYQQGWTNFV